MENGPILALSGLASYPLGTLPSITEFINKKQPTFTAGLQHAGSGILLEPVSQLRHPCKTRNKHSHSEAEKSHHQQQQVPAQIRNQKRF
jgi:hypothetical protein